MRRLQTKKRKKGSNVSFVVSFIMFITFVIFIYILVNYKISVAGGKDNSLTSLKENLLDAASGNLTITSVSIGHSTQDCIGLSDFFTDTGADSRSVVQDSSGTVFSAYTSSGDLDIDRTGENQSLFFRVYSSSEFPDLGSPTTCPPSSYTLGISKTYTYVLESKVSQLLSNYTSDYSNLKKEMKIGSSDEFGFGFTYSNGTRVGTQRQNLTIATYSETVPVEYISSSSGMSQGFMDITVW